MKRCLVTCGARARFSRIYSLASNSIFSSFGHIPLTSWVCQWKLFWIPVGDTFQKAYLEEWQRVDDGSTCDPGEYSTRTVPCVADSRRQQRAENSDNATMYEQPLDAPSAPRSPWQAVEQPDAPTWKLSGTEGTPAFWQNRRHHCLSRNVCAILFTQSSSVSFGNVQNCCFQTERSCQALKTFPSYVTVLLRG